MFSTPALLNCLMVFLEGPCCGCDCVGSSSAGSGTIVSVCNKIVSLNIIRPIKRSIRLNHHVQKCVSPSSRELLCAKQKERKQMEIHPWYNEVSTRSFLLKLRQILYIAQAQPCTMPLLAQRCMQYAYLFLRERPVNLNSLA